MKKKTRTPPINIKRKNSAHTKTNFIRPARKITTSFMSMLVVIAMRIAKAATVVETAPALVNSETENVTTLKLATPPKADVT